MLFLVHLLANFLVVVFSFVFSFSFSSLHFIHSILLKLSSCRQLLEYLNMFSMSQLFFPYFHRMILLDHILKIFPQFHLLVH